MPDTSKMTPEEYAAFTGNMSFPTGAQKQMAEHADRLQSAAMAANYVQMFMRDLEDPAMRLVTEKAHDWKCWGDEGKAAILAVVREGAALVKNRAAVKVLEEATYPKAKASANDAMVANQIAAEAVAEPEPTPAMVDPEDDPPFESYAVAKWSNPGAKKCTEPDCDRVGTHMYGKSPYCKKHFDAIPF